MKRDLAALARREYDVAVVGAGIYGISVARDAALRGLRVALIDKGDFGHATSSNHHKIIHGGFRYLQHGNLKRMRESIRERSVLLRIAPHLVRPLPFLIPIYKATSPSKLLMNLALRLNDLIGIDRNNRLDRHKRIPNGRVVSRSECLQLCPALDQPELTAGAIYFDGQVNNPDRLNLALLLSAVRAGAEVANYAQATGFIRNKDTLTGLEVTDVLSGRCFSLRARTIVNCAGPWIDCVLRSLEPGARRAMHLSKALVLITRPIVRDIAVGVPSPFKYSEAGCVVRKGFRYFFMTPWRNTTLIGTAESPYEGEPEDFRVTKQDIDHFLTNVNAAFPAAGIRRQDVYGVLSGLLPSENGASESDHRSPKKRHEILDHAVEDGIQGIVSVLGIKYTTARSVAEEAVDLVFEKLAHSPARCMTANLPVHGGAMGCFTDFLSRALQARRDGIGANSLETLVHTYGAEYQEVLRYCDADRRWSAPVASDSPVIKAQVLHGVREEMAQTLSDVIFRRTELGTAGYPGDRALWECAEIMASELGWSGLKVAQEIEETQSEFDRRSA